MYIFDAYTRFFGRDFYQFQTVRQADGSTEIRLKQGDNGGSDNRQVSAHRRSVLEAMDSCGVSGAVIYAAVIQEMDAVGEAARQSGGRLVPFAAVNPASPSSLAALDRLRPRYGFRGLIMFPSMHGYAIGDGNAAAVLDYATTHNMVVYVHYGAPRVEVRALIGLDPDSTIDRGHPENLIPVARSRADLTFTVPFSGGSQLEEFLALGDSCPNVCANIVGSGAAGDHRKRTKTLAGIFSETRRAYGVQRILYGSDSGGFSQNYREDVLETQIAAMIAAGFTEVERAAVLGGNASRLLDLV